ncbi:MULTISPECIES: hypothetical protein [unclassified Streptomyces]|uniref:hypothetical protein n=1 Tax=unclassified Streptomyces TaxID=2593676 RepID=UPI003D9505C4
MALYVFVGQRAVGGFDFWLATKMDAPLGAVGGAVGVAILSNVLDAITALAACGTCRPRYGSTRGSTGSSPAWSGPA